MRMSLANPIEPRTDAVMKSYLLTPRSDSAIKLNVRERGEGPLAILLHGITANAAVWDPIAEYLGQRLNVLAIDQRGHGRSHKPMSGYTAEDFSYDVKCIVEEVGRGKAVLIGHSLGARNAVFTAALYPKLFSAVVAIDFTPFIEKEVFEIIEKRLRAGDKSFQSLEEVEDYLRQRYQKTPIDAIKRRAQFGFEETVSGWRPLAYPAAIIETHKAIANRNVEEAYRSLPLPLMLIRGAESTVVSAQAFEKTRRLRPDAEAIVFDNTDHYVHEEEPQLVGAKILEFLTRNNVLSQAH